MRVVNIVKFYVCVGNGVRTWLGCWLLGMMMFAVTVCGSVGWFEEVGGSRFVGLKGWFVRIEVVLCCFAMLSGLKLSLLYRHEPRVGCHVEGGCHLHGTFADEIYPCMMTGYGVVPEALTDKNTHRLGIIKNSAWSCLNAAFGQHEKRPGFQNSAIFHISLARTQNTHPHTSTHTHTPSFVLQDCFLGV